MSVPTLEASNLGPIKRAHVRFGDLTVFVGPQATGKSILLQFVKLMLDAKAVAADMRRQGLDWDNRRDRFLDVYLGEGMSGVWRPGQSKLKFNGRPVPWGELMDGPGERTTAKLFYVPAQRTLTLGRVGWPRSFSDYSPGDPYVVRAFSETLRLLLESPRLGQRALLFPRTHWLKPEFRRPLQETIFRGFGLYIDRSSPQKRLVLRAEQDGESLPFMVWSAGQREFVPLLLGFYRLFLEKGEARQDGRWAVIEEPELGLHPRAISALLPYVLELLGWGYRVCLSTHSPHVLDVVWALKIIRENHAESEKLWDLFDIKDRRNLTKLAGDILARDARVYYFDPETSSTMEISELDPGSEDVAMRGWGGLTEFSEHVGDVVADVVNGS